MVTPKLNKSSMGKISDYLCEVRRVLQPFRRAERPVGDAVCHVGRAHIALTMLFQNLTIKKTS